MAIEKEVKTYIDDAIAQVRDTAHTQLMGEELMVNPALTALQAQVQQQQQALTILTQEVKQLSGQ